MINQFPPSEKYLEGLNWIKSEMLHHFVFQKPTLFQTLIPIRIRCGGWDRGQDKEGSIFVAIEQSPGGCKCLVHQLHSWTQVEHPAAILTVHQNMNKHVGWFVRDSSRPVGAIHDHQQWPKQRLMAWFGSCKSGNDTRTELSNSLSIMETRLVPIEPGNVVLPSDAAWLAINLKQSGWAFSNPSDSIYKWFSSAKSFTLLVPFSNLEFKNWISSEPSRFACSWRATNHFSISAKSVEIFGDLLLQGKSLHLFLEPDGPSSGTQPAIKSKTPDPAHYAKKLHRLLLCFLVNLQSAHCNSKHVRTIALNRPVVGTWTMHSW